MSELNSALRSELARGLGDCGPMWDSWRAAPLSAKIRLVLALVLTFTLLPYAWGRTFLIFMMTGWVEPPFAAQVVLGVLLISGLTFRLGSKFPGLNFSRKIAITVAVLWAMVCAALVILRAGELISPYPVALLFVPATVWLIWLAWMFFLPVPAKTRAIVFGLALLLIIPFVSIFRVDGLTGDANVDFNYRSAPLPISSIGSTLAAGNSIATARPVNLTPMPGVDFAQFQGPTRNAIMHDVKLARDWKAEPPKELWRVSVGEGWSGFAVMGEAAITQEQRGQNECVVCRNLLTGDELWVHSDEARYDSTMGGNGPRGTPTIANGNVYTIGATGVLNVIEGGSGKSIFTTNIQTDHNAAGIYHGVCASPLLIGDSPTGPLVVTCPTGADGRSLAAYQYGQLLWSKGKSRQSYSSPMLAEIAGVPQILLFNSEGLASHDPKTGELLWQFEWHNTQNIAASQPVLIPGKSDEILITTGYAKGCTLIRARRNAEVTWDTPEQLWSKTTMKTKFTTAVVHDGYAYGLDDGILQCIDLADGASKWKAGRYGHGQLILVDDLLLIQAESGDVVLVETNPKKLVEVSRLAAVKGKTWNNPTLAGRYLLTRNDHEAVCYELPLAK